MMLTTSAELQMHYVAGSLSLGLASAYCQYHESICLVCVCPVHAFLVYAFLGRVYYLMSTKAIDLRTAAQPVTFRCCTSDRKMLTGESLKKLKSSTFCSKAAPSFASHSLRRFGAIGGIRQRLFYAKTEIGDLYGDPYSTVFSTTTSLASYDHRHCFCDDGLNLICCDFGCSGGDCCSRDTASSDGDHGGSGGGSENASEMISGDGHFGMADNDSHLTDFLLGKCSIASHDDDVKRIDDVVSPRGDHLHKFRDLYDS